MANISRATLCEFLESQFNLGSWTDSSLNGVQIEGSETVTRVAVAVDAGLRVIERAVDEKADFLLVHHGLFWGKPVRIEGAHRKLLETAFRGGLTLYGAHLPLDAHQDWGNNFCLARLLELSDLEPAIPHGGGLIGCITTNKGRKTVAELTAGLSALPGARLPLLSLAFGPEVPERIAIVTGAGADVIYHAKDLGFDTLITGEPRQAVYHHACEQHLNALFGGHYATETIGVREVGRALEKHFGLPWIFIDEPTGI